MDVSYLSYLNFLFNIMKKSLQNAPDSIIECKDTENLCNNQLISHKLSKQRYFLLENTINCLRFIIECAHLYRIVQSKIHETHEILQYSCIPWILLCYLIKKLQFKNLARTSLYFYNLVTKATDLKLECTRQCIHHLEPGLTSFRILYYTGTYITLQGCRQIQF